jgi:hypothetical protein
MARNAARSTPAAAVTLLIVSLLSGCAQVPLPAATTTPTPAPPAGPTATAVIDPQLALVGPTETVFDWSTDRCGDEDIPDLGARAFRGADGRVTLVASHYSTWRFVGASLDELAHDCAPVMSSAQQGDPSLYSDRSWLAAPYTLDGQTVYALVHNEYQGNRHPGACPQEAYEPCWYNAVTEYISIDGGRTFGPIVPPPGHLVASLPHRYEAGAGPYGVFEPTNIIKHTDGMYYSYIRVDEFRSEAQRICLMRTATLDDPASWRAWDGSDFTIELLNPYRDPAGALSARPCAVIGINQLGVMGTSITFNTYLQRYVMVGTTATTIEGREVWGVLYAFSLDLIEWQTRQLLFEAELPWTYEPGDDNVYLYPVLLDPASDSRNFETTGEHAYLYVTRFNTREAGDQLDTLDRDLVRIPVRFFGASTDVTGTVEFTP